MGKENEKEIASPSSPDRNDKNILKNPGRDFDLDRINFYNIYPLDSYTRSGTIAGLIISTPQSRILKVFPLIFR
ncbi:MAG: hypothetical protein Q7R97_03560 [Candidatus Daviesbacteria bacterium]|nr:hypothetical protein [Candidatus Daviesbacteria bacterium]